METHGGFDINTGRDMHREKIQERKLNITKNPKKNTWTMQWLFRVHYHEDY